MVGEVVEKEFGDEVGEEKGEGVVKVDIEVVVFENKILKGEDMEREYMGGGMCVVF